MMRKREKTKREKDPSGLNKGTFNGHENAKIDGRVGLGGSSIN